jgi:hypothetical protein
LGLRSQKLIGLVLLSDADLLEIPDVKNQPVEADSWSARIVVVAADIQISTGTFGEILALALPVSLPTTAGSVL